MRVLYDTNVVSYWMAGHHEFHAPLRKLQHDLRSLRAMLYVSAVTIQELAVVGQMTGTWLEMHDFIRERFNTVPFTSLCAEKAAAPGRHCRPREPTQVDDSASPCPHPRHRATTSTRWPHKAACSFDEAHRTRSAGVARSPPARACREPTIAAREATDGTTRRLSAPRVAFLVPSRPGRCLPGSQPASSWKTDRTASPCTSIGQLADRLREIDVGHDAVSLRGNRPLTARCVHPRRDPPPDGAGRQRTRLRRVAVRYDKAAVSPTWRPAVAVMCAPDGVVRQRRSRRPSRRLP